MDLKRLVLDKIDELGVTEAKRFFGVSLGTISNWSSGKTSPSVDAVQLVLPKDFAVINPPSPEPFTMWEGRKVHVCLPVYRSFCADTHYTLFANYAKYGAEKVGMSVEKRTMIHEARNILTAKALKTDAEWFLMIDDDMVLPCGSAGIMNGNYGANLPEPSASLLAFSRIMSHPKEFKVVGALYFGRHGYGKAQCHLGFSEDHQNDILRRHQKYTSLLPMGWVGTGMIRIHRSVFEEMQAEIEKGRWPECKRQNEARHYGFWNPQRVDVGEDVSFGRRCEEIGIVSYLDPVLECLHIGDVPFGSHNTTTKK